MKLILSHPTANAFVRSAAAGMVHANMLSEFHTSIAAFPGTLLDRLSAFAPLAEFKRRSFDLDLRPFTKTNPWKELGRQFSLKSRLDKLVQHESGYFSVDAVYNAMDKKVAARISRGMTKCVEGIYAYEDGAFYSFAAAKQRGLQCFYDLPIGYWRTARKYLALEKSRFPEYAKTLEGLTDSDAKLERKDVELQMADCIFVASSFTARTLKDFPGQLAPVEVIPYAFPAVMEHRRYDAVTRRKLRVLFVGGLSQRKGIADLFAAVAPLHNHVSLTVVGLKASHECPALDAALNQHHWIPSLPHAQILELMRAHDVLVFPSLFEGFGLVISEAMSQGTPVITTDRTAGPDIIEDGCNGWLIQAGCTATLQAAIEQLLNKPQCIAEVGKAAQETARNRTWKHYELELTQAIARHYAAKKSGA